MNEIEYINASKWADDCGVSHQRAHQVLQQSLPPGTLRLWRGQTWTYCIPKGTPWPHALPKQAPKAPEGYLLLKEWIVKVGKSREAANAMFRKHGAPEGTKRQGYRYLIPEDAGWTYPRPGNPFGRGGRPKV